MNQQQPNAILLELQYLPSIQYFTKLIHYPTVYIEQQENYVKGTYRNRCHIASANGLLPLSIPLEKGKHQRKPIRDVNIAYTQPWFSEHWHAIRSAYGNAPFFEYYGEEIEAIYRKKNTNLFQFNLTFINTIIDLLGLEVNMEFTTTYHKVVPEHWIDFRNAIHPKVHKQVVDPKFQPMEYPQIFEARHGFIPNLSILDLLFCTGPESILYLESSFININ